jgi:hypothetical protein
MSPDDSGKVYSSVLSPTRRFYFLGKVTPGQEDYRITDRLDLGPLGSR